jgi:hypothetical protein
VGESGRSVETAERKQQFEPIRTTLSLTTSSAITNRPWIMFSRAGVDGSPMLRNAASAFCAPASMMAVANTSLESKWQ